MRLRVHMTAADDELERVLDPLRTLRADVVVIFVDSADGGAAARLTRITDALGPQMPVVLAPCDFTDPTEIVGEMGALVAAAPGHEYLVNVSAGPKNVCLAGIVASMFWHLRPYIVPVGARRAELGRLDFVPTIPVPMPSRAALESLIFLADHSKPVRKFDLINHLKDQGLVGPRTKTEVRPQALQAQVDRHLRVLNEWGFLEMHERGKLLRIEPTANGRQLARIFRRALRPPPPPPALVA